MNSIPANIQDILAQFEAKSLPKEAWTHEAHLIVAISYCLRYSVDEALDLLRIRIASYNESVGGMNTDTDGYHESITHFWLLVARAFINRQSSSDLTQLCQDFCASEMGSRTFPLKFYSADRLFSVEARKSWIEPDLMTLDQW